jgi:hypothetical protein
MSRKGESESEIAYKAFLEFLILLNFFFVLELSGSGVSAL